MNTTTKLAATLGMGAGLMYLLDPERGERRRARVGAALVDAAGGLGDVTREALARGRGLADEWSDVDIAGTTRRLANAVPARTFRPDVGALTDEARRLGREVGAVVRDPSLLAPRWRQSRLTLRRRSAAEMIADKWWAVAGVLVGAAAVAWLARSAGGRIEARHAVTIDAPVERVFDAWRRFESFPRFMSAVREVRETGRDRTHWVVGGPAGMPVEWDAVTTRMEPHRAIAWRTVEGALLEHRGTVRFHRLGAERTRIEVTMSYRSVGGGLGQSIASILGADPQRVIEEDLERFKSQMEPTHAGNGRSR